MHHVPAEECLRLGVEPLDLGLVQFILLVDCQNARLPDERGPGGTRDAL